MRKFPKLLYYVLTYTWALPMTLIGWIVAGVLWITGHRARRYGPCFVFTFGNSNWGGFSIGTTIVIDNDPDNFPAEKGQNRLFLDHEFGHSVQSALFGPFMPFLVSIPSVIRYDYLMHKVKNDPDFWTHMDYDKVWFEGTATKWGNSVFVNTWLNGKGLLM